MANASSANTVDSHNKTAPPPISATTTTTATTTPSGGLTTSGLAIKVASAKSTAIDNDAVTAATAAADRGESATVSGYGIAQTLDFAAEVITDAPEAIHISSSSASVASPPLGISNSHQNGMLLMAMLLDNKTNIESKDTKPAIAIFDFNPEDIQDLAGNDFYAVDNTSTDDNDVGESSAKQQRTATTVSTTTTTTSTASPDESLWVLPESPPNPLTMPLVMKTNGQALPGAAMASVSEMEAATEKEPDSGDAGNIYKVKLKRKPEAKRRDRHYSISSQMNVLGNDMSTIAQFQTLITMFDHWQWNEEKIAEQVSTDCAKDVKTYLKSLRAGELWALKGES